MLAEFNLHYFIACMTSEEAETIRYLNSEEEEEMGRMPSPPPAPRPALPPPEGDRGVNAKEETTEGGHWWPPARRGGRGPPPPHPHPPPAGGGNRLENTFLNTQIIITLSYYSRFQNIYIYIAGTVTFRLFTIIILYTILFSFKSYI